MADITTFINRESVIHAAFQALEKEGINISLPFPKDVSLPDAEESGVFGVPLDSNQRCSVRYRSQSVIVPKFFADAVEFLEGYLAIEGLFRKAGSLTRQREIKAHVQSGGSLANHHKPHDVACLLKLFLRELPDPLLTSHLAPAFTRTHTFEQRKQRACVMLLCLLLPQTHLSCLQVLCQFLHKVSINSDQNLMDTVNLALVMAPNLLPFTASTTKGGHEQCLEASTSVVKILIEHYEEVGLVPEEIATVARQLQVEGGCDYKGKSAFAARSFETPDGLDGSTGDELDSDGELPSGLVRKKSTKKSRTRMFVHNLGNKLRSRYGNKNTDTKTPNSSPVTKEHMPHILSNMNSVDGSSSPLVMTKRKADYDPHLMSASKRQAILQHSIGTSSKLRSGKLFRTPLTMKATKRSILRRCRHTDYGKTRKNAYLVLQPSYSIESFVDKDPNCEHSASVAASSHLTSTCNNTEMPGSHKTIPLSKGDDGFPLVEFSMSSSIQKSVNKSSTPVCTKQDDTKDPVANDDHSCAGRLPNVKSKSVPPKPLKTSISADNVKYFSATPEINFIKINNDEHKQSNPYKFAATSSHYPRSISDHQGLKSSYKFGSGSNLVKSSVNSTSTYSNSKELRDENRSVDTQNTLKPTNHTSSLKKSTSHPVICNLTGAQNATGISTHYPNSRSFKSSSLSPSKVTTDNIDISKSTKPKNNNRMQFEFSEPAVVQPVAAYVLEVDTPQQYSDVEKDPENSEVYSTDEVQVSYLESQDVRKQLFADADHDEALPPHQKKLDGGSKDDGLFGNPLKNMENTEANISTKCSDLLEEISSDLAEKHRYSPNYVTPLTSVQSTNKYDNNEILDYTGSPHHCVTADRVMVNTKCWQDDYQQSKLDSHGIPPAQCSPDPWAVRKQTKPNINGRDHVYKVTKEDTSRHIDFSEADSSEPSALSQITTITAASTTNDDQSTTPAVTSSVAISFAMGTQMAVTTSANSSDNYSATPPSSYRRKSAGPTSSSMLAKINAPHFPSQSGFYTLRNNRHTVKASHIDTRPVNTTVSLSTVTAVPKLSLAGISKTSTMPKFYKEMVPLSRKALNNSENVRTKIQQFEGITTLKEKGHSYCKAYGLTAGIVSEVRELENSPQQHCSKVRRSGTWNFHSPAPMKQVSVQGGTSKSNIHTHYTFHCPKVKSEAMHRVSDRCSQYRKMISTSENTSGDERRETTGGITGRKRSSPTTTSQTYKTSRPLHHYNSNDDQVTGSNSSSTTEYKVIPTLSLSKGKENNQPAADNSQVLSIQDEGIIRKQQNNMSVPPIRTTILREWII